ncbi:MAG: PilT/PilU family type 4a pilus ATPase, partial [Planctomycetes bacterium]|nr:PilT/PilU family type 4a pilus ATPase [Planctomycetota bacterium]
MATVNMDRLLQACVSQNGSDIHLVTGRPPVIRIDGRLRSLETKVLEPDDTVALMKSITPERNQQELQEEGGTDFGFAFGDIARFRVAIFRQKGNISMVLRLIPTKIMGFDEIGLPEVCAALCRRPRGMFLVTGPTGSGKTTTLACMVNYINENFDRHIITIEEPIEYYHKHKRAIINQREVGIDVPSFSEALRRVLRQDPDVILVGELRDLETIEAAVRAAETGHLVFSTLHTTSASGTITRIIDVFPVNQQEQIRIQLSSNLIAVLSQALCPVAVGKG